MLGIAAILLGSIGLLALHTMVMHQVLAINFPMRMRWVFHRLMLGQSMSFYADEFAGRITTKIMQTALAVREVIFIVVDVLVGVAVYFISILLLAGSFDAYLLLPFGMWLLCYAAACWYFVPRLGAIGKAAGRCALADDGPRHRCLYQHHHRQTVCPHPPRSRIRTQCNGRL